MNIQKETAGNSQFPKQEKYCVASLFFYFLVDFLIFIVILSFKVDTEVWKGQAKDLEKQHIIYFLTDLLILSGN